MGATTAADPGRDRHHPPAKREAAFIPGVLDVSVTDYCNADCDFCGFAKSKMRGKPRRFVDRAGFERALPILARRGIRYLNFQGGEPLLHPKIIELVAATRRADMKPGLITNGWNLADCADALADAGLQSLQVSIDSADIDAHEENRGLRGLGERIQRGVAKVKAHGVPVMACVTVSKLVDYEALPDSLRRLGLDSVSFSYPRKEPWGSSSLVYGDDSDLVDFTDEELLAALDAMLRLKRHFTVLNPSASIRDVQRHVRGEPERFACVGGFKYFYMDWRLDIWRCEAWREPMGSVFDLDHFPDDRTPCTACMMSCYRNASALMHVGIAAADAAQAMSKARPIEALRAVFKRSVAQSLGAVVQDASLIGKIGLQSRAAVPAQRQAPSGGPSAPSP